MPIVCYILAYLHKQHVRVGAAVDAQPAAQPRAGAERAGAMGAEALKEADLTVAVPTPWIQY